MLLYEVKCYSVSKSYSCKTLCDYMDCSTGAFISTEVKQGRSRHNPLFSHINIFLRLKISIHSHHWNFIHLCYQWAEVAQLPGATWSSAGTESACNSGDPRWIPGSGSSPGEGIGYPLQNSCLENSHGHRSLEGYSPWGCKESDTTERLSTEQHTPLTEIIGFRILHLSLSKHHTFASCLLGTVI